MIIYATVKYHKNIKMNEILEYYTSFPEANSDICKDVIAVQMNNNIWYKTDFQKNGFNAQWVGIIRKKDFSKRYFKANGDIYLIKEIKVNG